MKVILLQDVDNLGDKNDIKDVAAGYARNYLMPRGLAMAADKTGLKELERRRMFAARREAKIEKDLVKAADKIRGSSLEMLAHSGPEGKLYGSVSQKQIAAALSEKFKFEIDKKRVRIDEPIRKLGEHRISVQLKEGVIVDVTVNVKSTDPEPEPEPETEVKAAAEPAPAASEPADAAPEPEAPTQEQADAPQE